MTFSQEPPQDRIVPTDLRNEMQRSYLEYAMSVIVGRALPDSRDGLKPVHRRILYAMHELGLAPDRPFRKCARVVGEVLGKYHPHGDTAVYDALVRMAQDFSMRSPLIDGHGNFGSIDNDPPAAMRYTECRLRPLTRDALLQDIESETVDFGDNFDGSQQEPLVLPSRIPQLLLNGSSGIAVGMATNIPPHNLGELIDGLVALIHNPDITVQELMHYIPGPDFPTGGQILGLTGIREAYNTGRGSVIMRGVANIETIEHRGRPDREAIIVTELPYQTNKAALIEKIAEMVNDRRLWRWALVCLGIAVPAYLLLLGGLVDGGYRTPAILLFGFAGTVPFRPLMVVGYACLIILATRRNGWLTQRIAAAGRAAFTNYLGTSIVMTALFYGWGLGLFGMLGRAELALVTLAAWAGMLLWSKPWLDRYRYGPLEWLWRSLTNGRSESMRRTAIA